MIVLVIVAMISKSDLSFAPQNSKKSLPLAGPTAQVSSRSKLPGVREQSTNSLPKDDEHCTQVLKELSEKYALKELSHSKGSSERFHNRHLELGPDIFRLRSFYDDAAEGEQLTYIVYLEDENEFADIKEKRALQKGPLYLQLEEKIQEGQAKILYDEIAYSLVGPDNRELFLHYKDGQLIGAQGSYANNHLECTLK